MHLVYQAAFEAVDASIRYIESCAALSVTPIWEKAISDQKFTWLRFRQSTLS